MKRTVLVIAAHPDDEILGCGATMALHASKGDAVHILILGEGATSRGNSSTRHQFAGVLDKLRNAARKAAVTVGAKSVEFGNLPDNRFDSLALLDIVKIVEQAVTRLRPSIVYTHHSSDVNVDHRLTRDAVVTACRAMPGSTVETVLFFEIASSTEWQMPDLQHTFAPNWFVNVTSTAARKLQALRAYGMEMRPWPHPRSFKAVEHQLRWRGASVGVDAAEAFVLGRRIEK
jgi:LmbE family N-acetylglucosaminyl deacetylase